MSAHAEIALTTHTHQPGVNLLSLDQAGLREYFQSLGESPFRAQQLMRWVYHDGIFDFANMLNFPKQLRAKLAGCATLALPTMVQEHLSTDGTIKWLLQFGDRNAIETVFIPENQRGTLCVSSQVGCGLNCRFCATATQGFNRNLLPEEIIGQVLFAKVRLRELFPQRQRVLTNVVMMGMGEPLLNYRPVVLAMNVMMDDLGFGLSKHRVTLSTSGVVPAMLNLKKDSQCSLAVSLHAPNDALRSELVPINRKYPLEMLLDVCRAYFEGSKRRVVMEYVMLHGVNDNIDLAKQLVRCLEGIPCKVNLIPFNTFPGTRYERSPPSVIERFSNVLERAGLVVTVRRPRGEDVLAACGNLFGDFKDRTQRSAKHALAVQQES